MKGLRISGLERKNKGVEKYTGGEENYTRGGQRNTNGGGIKKHKRVWTDKSTILGQTLTDIERHTEVHLVVVST